MVERRKPKTEERAEDEVTEAGLESFPASDPPAFNRSAGERDEPPDNAPGGDDAPTSTPAGPAVDPVKAREFERRLRDRYAAVWADIQRELEKYRSERYRDIVEQGADPDDEAAADLLIDLNIAEINRDVDELRAVQAALERIKRGTFGLCAVCGEPIAAERLDALPQAALCLDCQAREERRRAEGTPSL